LRQRQRRKRILVWAVRAGTWNGATLDGLSVIAVVRTDATLATSIISPAAARRC